MKDPDMKEVMIDLETLSTRHNAVVLSIGAVTFKDRQTFMWQFDLEQQVRQGRHIDPETIAWWMKQGDEAQRTAFAGTRVFAGAYEDTCSGLLKLNVFLEGAEAVWAKGPAFDFTILRSLYEDNMIDLGWDFRCERDVRTMQDFLPEDYSPSCKKHPGFIKHNPVHDCDAQIQSVMDARAEIYGPRSTNPLDSPTSLLVGEAD